jgi:uncharacterized protein YpuA (DUF1002 family)
MSRKPNQSTPEDRATIFHEVLEELESELKQSGIQTQLVDRIGECYDKGKSHDKGEDIRTLIYDLGVEVEKCPITDSEKERIKRLITKLKAANVAPYPI